MNEAEEMEKIKKEPHKYICNFYEGLYPYMGGKVMSILCLLPCSLILPPLTDSNGKKTMVRISYLLLAVPGTAKSALSEHFKQFTFNPFTFESITDSKLNFVLSYRKRATLITSDIARVFSERELVKEMENIVGDEGKLSRLNRNTGDEEQKVEVIGYFAGTPENLTRTIQDGMVFRVYPQIIYHTEKEHSNILSSVNKNIGGGFKGDAFSKEKIIIDYYQKLLAIQDRTEGADFPRIDGYIFQDEFREKIKKELIPLFSKPFLETNFEFIRELIRCYRIMVSSAFLNIYNRKIKKDGDSHYLIIDESDLNLALQLSKEEIRTKTIILNSLNRISEKRLRTMDELKMWAQEEKKKNREFSYDEYKTMEVILKNT
jgi:hypothetical protein